MKRPQKTCIFLCLVLASILGTGGCQRHFVPGTHKQARTLPPEPDILLSIYRKAGPQAQVIWEYNCLGAPGSTLHRYGAYIYGTTRTGRYFMVDPARGRAVVNRQIEKESDLYAVIMDSVVIAGFKKKGHTLRGYDTEKGQKLWERSFEAISVPIVPMQPYCIVGTESGWLYLVDARNGRTVWKAFLESRIKGISRWSDLKIYVSTNRGYVYCINTGDGSMSWYRALRGQLFSEPALSQNGVYVGTNRGTVYGLSVLSGSVVWRKKLPGAVFKKTVIRGNSLYAVTTRSVLYCLNRTTGVIQWKTQLPALAGTNPVLEGGVIFLGGLDGSVWTLSAETGDILSHVKVKGRISTDIAVLGTSFIAGTEKGRLYGFSIR